MASLQNIDPRIELGNGGQDGEPVAPRVTRPAWNYRPRPLGTGCPQEGSQIFLYATLPSHSSDIAVAVAAAVAAIMIPLSLSLSLLHLPQCILLSRLDATTWDR